MSDDSAEDKRTEAIYQMSMNNIAADRDLWKFKYRILERILAYHGMKVIEKADGVLDIAAMREKGIIPPRGWSADQERH